MAVMETYLATEARGDRVGSLADLASAEPGIDIGELNAISSEIVESMQEIRGLFEARAQALEDSRAALAEYHQNLAKDYESFSTEQNQFCESMENRQNELTAREKECEELKRRLEETAQSRDAQSEEVAGLRSALDAREKEVEERQGRLEDMEKELAQRESRLAKEQKAFQSGQDEIKKSSDSLVSQKQALAQQIAECERRESQISAMAARLEAKERDVDVRASQISGLQQEWDRKMSDLQGAQENLTQLQKQLREELSKMANSKTELLPVDASAPANGPDGMGGPAGQQARQSIERFQKLCRDAKRRAIGH